ncbi:MAG: DUF1592 domain-containing protein [Rubripirellula sp.]
MKTLDCLHRTRQGRFDQSDAALALRCLGMATLLLLWSTFPPNASSQNQDEAAPVDPLRDDAMLSFKTKVHLFVKKYCVDCHNTRPEAQLNLESALRNPESAASFGLWKKAVASVKVLDMPPADASELPTDQERQDFLDSIAKLKYLAPRDPGPFTLRRLSKVEFGNTLHALYGVDSSLSSILPDEVVGEGYLNSISPLQSELYLGIANQVLRSVIAEPGSPLNDKQQRLLGNTPAEPKLYRAEAKKVALSLASDAYRRPPSASELEALLSVFDLGQENQLDYMSSLALMWKAILVSPQFLFITPQPGIENDASIVPLDDYQLASRLSYLLWSHPPDDELRALAEAGKLSDPSVLESQVQRLLADVKSRALFDTFGAQWLSVGGLLDQTFDPDLFPEMTPAVRNAMLEEVRWFFQSIVSENQSIFRFVDSDYTFIRNEIADWYGIEKSNEASTVRRVKITDPNRGGILGMPAVLASTSFPTRTSPVKRGVWFLEQVLGEHVPPPPPDVPDLAASLIGDPRQLSLRERTERHQSDSACANCHKILDPIGFGFENFDAIGRWKTVDTDGQPIDSQGSLPSGREFASPAELKEQLIERKGDVARNVTARFMAFSLGRPLESYDERVLDEIMNRLAPDDYPMGTMIGEVITSYLFTHRRISK